MAQYLTPSLLQMNDASAVPLVGAKLYIYASDTTTLLSLFSDEDLSTGVANPIVADAAGVFASAFIAETRFKAVLKTSADAILYTRDPVYSTGQSDDIPADNVSFDGAGIGFSSTNVQDALVEMFESNAQLSGADFTGPISVTTSLSITMNDPGGGGGPNIYLYRNSASPAANDWLGYLSFSGNDSGGNLNTYSSVLGYIVDTTNGSEDGGLFFQTQINGSLDTRLAIAQGLFMAGATGGDKGAGSINAGSLFVNGAAVPFTKAFESAQQTITSGGSLTIAHGLGVAPKLYVAVLQCTTSNIGYSVGDEVAINPSISSDGGGDRGISLVSGATDISVRFASDVNAISLIRKDTGGFANITNSSWGLVVRAWT